MTRKLLLTIVLTACIALQAAVQLSAAPPIDQSTFGDIRGVTGNHSGLPLSDVQVVVHSVEENTDRTVLSGADGTFAFENLRPGHYQLTARKEGFGSLPATTLELAAGQSLHNDIVLASPNGFMASSQPALPAVTENSDRTTPTERETQLLDRIVRLEQRLAAMEAKEAKGANQTASASLPVLASQDSTAAAAQAPTSGLLTTPAKEVASNAAPPQAGSVATPAPAPPVIPEPLQAPDSTPGVDNFTPFAYGDFSWLNGSPRNNPLMDTKFFTPEIRFDTNFTIDTNQPKDHSLGGSTETFRSGEVQVEQISVGGDFHWQNVRGRILTMMGMFSTTTPRNDASAGVGQWDTRNAYRYVSEAWGGYHFNVNHGLNIDAGIFVSYIGLFSYYNFDNWAYQPSYVSSNTPWFFNGVRVQWFPTNKLKIEPWFVNGWQSYNKFNGHPGLGGQILYQPKEWLKLVFNNYGMGTDTLGNPNRSRIHTDDSIEVRYYNKPEKTSGLDKMAFTFTGDMGCEYGGGVTCHGGAGGPKQAFLGWMFYNRFWFNKDKYALTFGGGMMSNPGRYLTLLPPINGADAVSGSPYFTANPGDKAHMWDSTVTFDWMPKSYITWRFETGYRHSDVPYWTGRQGITPPGGNTGAPSQYVCAGGGAAGTNDLTTAYANCGGAGSVWFPDLRKNQFTATIAVMVKF